MRLVEYMRSQLGDPRLSPARIAAEHHISVRQLYKVLAADGIGPGEWSRRQRLERCRRELADPLTGTDPIGTVARRWGFTDPSGFGRSFRAAYGLTPSQWRDERRHSR